MLCGLAYMRDSRPEVYSPLAGEAHYVPIDRGHTWILVCITTYSDLASGSFRLTPFKLLAQPVMLRLGRYRGLL